MVLFSITAITQSYPGTAEVKSAKSAAIWMIKGGVKPNNINYHSIIVRLYKGGSRSVVMIKITQKLDELLLLEHYNLVKKKYDWTANLWSICEFF